MVAKGSMRVVMPLSSWCGEPNNVFVMFRSNEHTTRSQLSLVRYQRCPDLKSFPGWISPSIGATELAIMTLVAHNRISAGTLDSATPAHFALRE